MQLWVSQVVLVVDNLSANVRDAKSVQFSHSAMSSSPTDCGMPGLPVHHQLLEPAQTHVHRVGETQVWSLGQEDPLEESIATHSSFLTWRILWTEEPAEPQFIWLQRVGREGQWLSKHAILQL